MPPKRSQGGSNKGPTRTKSAAGVETTTPTIANADSVTTEPQQEQTINTVPVQVPTGRLDGLSRTNSSLSNAAGSTTNPSTRPKLKYAPKSILRKSKQEREELNALYDPAKAESNLGAFGITRGGSSSRGFRGRGDRGRGRGRGGGGRDDVPSLASGPFALGSVITGKSRVSVERGGARSSSYYNKTSSSSSRSRIKKGDENDFPEGGYSSSESDGGPKVDVEYIELLTDSEAEDNEEGETKAKTTGGVGGLPIRIRRREHVDRVKVPSTDNKEDKKKSTEANAKPAITSKAKGKEKAVPAGEGELTGAEEIAIKAEPQDEDPIPNSPKLKKKESRSPEDKRRKPRATSSSHDKKPTLSSAEEIEEHERLVEDQMYMLTEFGPALSGVHKSDEGQNLMDNTTNTSAHDNKSDKLFLFQFPPIIPVLTAESDMVMLDAMDEDTKDESIIKRSDSPATEPQPNLQNPVTPKTQPVPVFRTLHQIQQAPIPAGSAGKVRVHQSGRITMIWGGIEFEVNRGTDCQFLQDIVVMQKDAGIQDEQGKARGRAWGMGQVKGKFVVSPDIRKLMTK